MDKKKITKPKQKNRTSKSSSTIQAIIFSRNWKTKDAKKWLKDNNLKPIGKVHKTKKRGIKLGGSLKYTIQSAEDFKKIGFKKITSRGISILFGFK